MVNRETEHMNSGPNQPSSNNGGGRGRRRRRGRRGHGGAPQPQGQPQASNTQGAQPQNGSSHSAPSPAGPRRQHQGQQNRGPQNRRPGGGGGKFQRRQSRDRGPANPRTPDAGIYSAPMDHSYRQNMQDDNGNGRRQAGRYQEQGAEALTTTNNGSKSIYCFVDDLFFLAKIQETARKLNVKVEFVKGEKDVIDGIIALEEKPSLIIFDLNSNTSKPLTLIPKLKAKLKKETNFIGFLSHLQGDLKLKATEAGCDMVIPRSAFSQNLPQILRRHAADDLDEVEA
jgi:hypothetical protein